MCKTGDENEFNGSVVEGMRIATRVAQSINPSICLSIYCVVEQTKLKNLFTKREKNPPIDNLRRRG
jgi:hypothetical protein